MPAPFTSDCVSHRRCLLDHVFFSPNDRVSYGLAEVVLICVKSAKYVDFFIDQIPDETFEIEATSLVNVAPFAWP